MNALKVVFNPELEPGEDERTVCSARVPSREEIWAATKASPGAAWEKAKNLTPTLEDLKNIEVPDVDWSSYRQSLSSGFSRNYEATKDGLSGAVEATKGATGKALEASKGAFSGAWEKVTGSDENDGGE